MAAAIGHTQSLHTNSFDEAMALPTDASARIARNTQLILQHETGITDFIDPFGGSYYVETLTKELYDKAWDLIMEIEQLGGMAKAIESGLPKLKIEEAAAVKQARIDSGDETIVGVNKYKVEDNYQFEILEVDNVQVRESQIKGLNSIKSNRNNNKVNEILDKITDIAASGNGNLLEIAVEAALERATLGEISLAIEKVSGRHKAMTKTIAGVYSRENSNKKEIEEVRWVSDEFNKLEGRRPRILVAKMGQDGHDRGAKIIATAFADLGFDVDVGPLFSTPEEVAKQCVENDVHIVGISTLAAGHKTLLPKLVQLLKEYGREDILVIAGGVIPKQDYDFLFENGVFKVFGPGIKITDSSKEIINELIKRYS